MEVQLLKMWVHQGQLLHIQLWWAWLLHGWILQNFVAAMMDLLVLVKLWTVLYMTVLESFSLLEHIMGNLVKRTTNFFIIASLPLLI